MDFSRFIFPALFATLSFGLLAEAADRRPNIVIILSDDQSYTDYSFMGHESIETPHLDKLASESALFRRAYVPTALCRPALMTIATGLYSHQNKTTGNDPALTPANRAHLKDSGVAAAEQLISHIDETGSIAKWLGDEGYVSHQSGKWWEGSFGRGGFTEGMTRGYPKPGGRHGDDGLKIGRDGMKPVFDFVDKAVAEEKPFFLWYAPFMPHTPHNPPARLHDKYLAKGLSDEVAKYYAMCEWFDETCGALVNHLDETGVGENTLIVYVADNGWIQADSGGYEPRSKRSPNEGGTRTPIMFRWPETIAAAERPELCSSIDIVPTILGAAGVTAAHDFPGLNLLPELKSGDTIDRNVLLGESFAHDIADIHRPEASLLYRWVIEDEMKLLLTYDGTQGGMKYRPEDFRPQLYDLGKDPDETTNLAASKPDVVKSLAARIDNWWPATGRKTVVEWSDDPVILETIEDADPKPKKKGKKGKKGKKKGA